MTRSGYLPPRSLSRFLQTAVFGFAACWLGSCARGGTTFSQIVVIGDSLSDTGDFADTTSANFGFRYPGHNYNYADGRFTDDGGTTPAATKYQGVWHEQLARFFLGMAPSQTSLDGGTDYAFGDAETLDGKRSVTVAPGASVQVDNMGQQVTNYLSGHATDPAALYIIWGGANDLFMDDSTANVAAAAQRETALVRRLAETGAKTLFVPNLPPLGLTPSYSGNATQSAALNQASSTFRDQLNADLDALQTTLAGEGLTVIIYRLDIFDLFTSLNVSGGQAYGFTNVTGTAQGQSVAPDQYLFWDGIHPTTAGHYQIAAQAYTLLSNVPVVKLTVTLETAPDGTGTRQAHIAFSGIPGRSYRIQSSDDLISWVTRTTLTPDAMTGRGDFIDPAPVPPKRFYRALQP